MAGLSGPAPSSSLSRSKRSKFWPPRTRKALLLRRTNGLLPSDLGRKGLKLKLAWKRVTPEPRVSTKVFWSAGTAEEACWSSSEMKVSMRRVGKKGFGLPEISF